MDFILFIKNTGCCYFAGAGRKNNGNILFVFFPFFILLSCLLFSFSNTSPQMCVMSYRNGLSISHNLSITFSNPVCDVAIAHDNAACGNHGRSRLNVSDPDSLIPSDTAVAVQAIYPGRIIVHHDVNSALVNARCTVDTAAQSAERSLPQRRTVGGIQTNYSGATYGGVHLSAGRNRAPDAPIKRRRLPELSHSAAGPGSEDVVADRGNAATANRPAPLRPVGPAGVGNR
jgi:hypothetical protein